MNRQFSRYAAVIGALIACLVPVSTTSARDSLAPGGIQITHLAMVTATTGWATTSNGVARTTDGGLSWHTVLTVPKPPATVTNGGWFAFASIGPDEARVVSAGAQGLLRTFQTGNAGATWTHTHQHVAGSRPDANSR